MIRIVKSQNFWVSCLLFLLCACSSVSETPQPAGPAPTKTEGASVEPMPQPMPIGDYVRQTFIQGVPYEQTITNYGASDASILLAMLNDPREEQFWPNVVVVLNMIGGEDIVEPVIDFINTGVNDTYSRPHFSAKTSALLSLGYLVHRTGSEVALGYLIDSLDPAIWQERGTSGMSPFANSLDETHYELSKQAIFGLALSGNAAAAAALREFQVTELQGSQAVFQARVADLVAEAITTNAEIADSGLIAYYRDNR